MGEDFDAVRDVLAGVQVRQAVALTAILWPAFLEYRGCVFREFAFHEATVDEWFEQLDEDRESVESVVNNLHLWDVFAPASDTDYAALSALAPHMAEMWRAALRRAFPHRDFRVSVAEELEDYGPTLTFCSAGRRG